MSTKDRFSSRGPMGILFVAGIIAVAIFCWELMRQGEQRDDRIAQSEEEIRRSIREMVAEANASSEDSEPLDFLSALMKPTVVKTTEPESTPTTPRKQITLAGMKRTFARFKHKHLDPVLKPFRDLQSQE